jgi:hypothetical protein
MFIVCSCADDTNAIFLLCQLPYIYSRLAALKVGLKVL